MANWKNIIPLIEAIAGSSVKTGGDVTDIRPQNIAPLEGVDAMGPLKTDVLLGKDFDALPDEIKNVVIARLLARASEEGRVGSSSPLIAERMEAGPVMRSEAEMAALEDWTNPNAVMAGSSDPIASIPPGAIGGRPTFRRGAATLDMPMEERLAQNVAEIVEEGKRPRDINAALSPQQVYQRYVDELLGIEPGRVRDPELYSSNRLIDEAGAMQQALYESTSGGMSKLSPDQMRKLKAGRNIASEKAPYGSGEDLSKLNIQRIALQGSDTPKDTRMMVADIMRSRGIDPRIAERFESGYFGKNTGGVTEASKRTARQKLEGQLSKEEHSVKANPITGEGELIPISQRAPQAAKEIDFRRDKSEKLPDHPWIGALPVEDLRRVGGNVDEIDYTGEISQRQLDDIAKDLKDKGINDPDVVRQQAQPVVDRERNFELVARIRESLAQLREDLGTDRNFVKAKAGKEDFGKVARTIGRKSKTALDYVDKKGQKRYKTLEKGTLGMSSDDIQRQQKLRALVDDAEAALEFADEMGDPAITRKLGVAVNSGNVTEIRKAISDIIPETEASSLRGRSSIQKMEKDLFKKNKDIDKVESEIKKLKAREADDMLMDDGQPPMDDQWANAPKDGPERKSIQAQIEKLVNRKEQLIGEAEQLSGRIDEIKGQIGVSPQTRRRRLEESKVAEDMRRRAVQSKGSGDFVDDADLLQDDLLSYNMPDTELPPALLRKLIDG